MIGAGKTGEFICRELLNNSKHLMDPIGFLDDKANLNGKFIHSKKVLGSISDLKNFEKHLMKLLYVAQMFKEKSFLIFLKFVKILVNHLECFPPQKIFYQEV